MAALTFVRSGVFLLMLGSLFSIFPAMATEVPVISAVELAAQIQKNEAPFLLDVREPQEFEQAHIDGAVLIPLRTLSEHLNEVPKDKPVVVVCRSGNRSCQGTIFLMEHGFTNVKNLDGGMIAWSKRIASR